MQWSVFECELTAAPFTRLRGRPGKLLVPQESDTVRVYRLCAACVQQVEIIGAGPLETTPDVFIV